MLNIRWMVTKDLEKVAEIELRSNDYYLNQQDLVLLLRKRNVVAMVAEENEDIVGFMIYELLNRRIHLVSIAVHPKHRHIGIGTELIKKLISKLSPKRRAKIAIEVRESNLPLQMFLQKQGFIAVEVIRDYFTDSTEDAFVMHKGIEEEENS